MNVSQHNRATVAIAALLWFNSIRSLPVIHTHQKPIAVQNQLGSWSLQIEWKDRVIYANWYTLSFHFKLFLFLLLLLLLLFYIFFSPLFQFTDCPYPFVTFRIWNRCRHTQLLQARQLITLWFLFFFGFAVVFWICSCLANQHLYSSTPTQRKQKNDTHTKSHH